MKTCVNHDWMLYDILFNGKPFMNYNVLFNENVSKKIDTSVLDKRDQYFKGEFGLDPRSELSKKLIDPLDKEFIRMSSENPEPNDSMNAISKKEREISVVYVYVFINKKKIEGRPFTGEKIPGVSLATMLNGAYRDSCNWDSYFLAFGNWKSSVGRSDSEIHKFRFKHNANSHDIENLVVVLTGVKSRVDELLTKINWQQLNKLISN
ncbi:MAG: hypothetical protein M1480_19350 [Bacteroidetes bacterium]|nr:hypothetical protein [Bacteroidota bacterium]